MDGMAGAGAIIPELAGFAPEFRRSKRLLLAATGAGLAADVLVVGADWKSSKSSGGQRQAWMRTHRHHRRDPVRELEVLQEQQLRAQAHHLQSQTN